MFRKPCVVLAALTLVAAACSPGSSPESVTAFDTVTTLLKPGTDFAGALTFSVVDSIQHLVDPSETDEISRQYDTLILSRVRDDMRALGWTEIPAPDSTHVPDVAMQVAVTTSEQTAIAYWPPYWGWYPGYGYPGYGYGWGYTTTYNYTTGTVLVAMLDMRHPDTASQTVPVVWLGGVNGVESNPGSNQTRIVNGIDQAFNQSPYLRK